MHFKEQLLSATEPGRSSTGSRSSSSSLGASASSSLGAEASTSLASKGFTCEMSTHPGFLAKQQQKRRRAMPSEVLIKHESNNLEVRLRNN